MLSKQFDFIEQLKNQDISWATIAEKYEEAYDEEITSEALRKRFKREVAYRNSLGRDPVAEAIKLIKKEPIKPTELARRFGLDVVGLEDLLDDLLNARAAIRFNSGYLVFDKSAPSPDNLIFNVDQYFTGPDVALGLIADTHLCSIHDTPEALISFYELCENEGVQAVLHGGDFFTGNGTVYKGQYQELKIIGESRQIDYAANTYPRANFPTFVVGGNHDLDLYKTAGVDILKNFTAVRPDITYLGKMSATLEFCGLRILLQHGEGGLGLARSYKAQKILDGMDTPYDLAVIGHWHIFEHMPDYHGTSVVLPGCFELQSVYLKAKSLIPNVGGVILKLRLGKTPKGKTTILRQQTEFINFSPFLRNE